MSHFSGVDVHHVRGQDHLKQWYTTEQRRRDNAAVMDPSQPASNLPRFDPAVKALADYRRLVQLTRDPQEAADNQANDPIYDAGMPSQQQEFNKLSTEHPPHQVHHHHFGWGAPQEEHTLGKDDSTVSYHKYGNAVGYCQNIHSKSSLMSTRR
mmetsp:Transcript_16598/g.22896  ORF Transcript_16598/g.22896 Transcript_16598/m.22896 type:complete len:153 (+) Transcript_16598:232-690(+)